MSKQVETPDLAHIAPALHHLAVPVDSLRLDESNPLDHGDDDLNQTTESLRLSGQVEPIVYNTRESNRIIHGNGRYLAARRLGWGHIAGVGVDLDPAAATRLAITLKRRPAVPPGMSPGWLTWCGRPGRKGRRCRG